ncbi:hypothetical protein WN51_05162 [Melipona quadrifasciata]|uniref:Uncharacterized protein n=1 Tax=Melipona quadrifasciata TaxID=166423 RepID=A0A0M8ZRQ6_9HYME|nr:hypothetical protein WN51_05162 [Melipona quadrifasciata]
MQERPARVDREGGEKGRTSYGLTDFHVDCVVFLLDRVTKIAAAIVVRASLGKTRSRSRSRSRP